MKRFFLFFFIFILFSISVSALLTTEIIENQIYFNETFNYADAYTNHGWTLYNFFLPTTPTLERFGDIFNNAGDAGLIYQEINFSFSKSSDANVITMIEFGFNQTESNLVGVGISDAITAIIPEMGIHIQNALNIKSGGSIKCTTPGIDLTTSHVGKWIIEPDGDTFLYIDGELLCSANSQLDTGKTYNKITAFGNRLGTLNKPAWIEYILMANVSVSESETPCDFPRLFCDDFNYAGSLMENNDWRVYELDSTLNTAITPTNNTLNLSSRSWLNLDHQVEPFPYGWLINEDVIADSGLFASQFSSEFKLNISNGTLTYLTHDYRFFRELYGIQFQVLNGDSNILIKYYNSTTQSYTHEANISGGANKFVNIKIVADFSHRSEFPFNSTFATDAYRLYADNQLIFQKHDFIDSTARMQYEHDFFKEVNATIIIDDYFVYVGSDKDTNTLDYTQVPPLEVEITETQNGTGTGDLLETVDGFWENLGLVSKTSKHIAGFFVLAVFLFMVISGMIAAKMFNFGAVFMLGMIFSIFLIFVGLLPLWLFFVYVFVAAGLGALALKMSMS